MTVDFRVCRVCKQDDFLSTLESVTRRTYQHTALWQKRCAWMTEHAGQPDLLSMAKESGLPGVAFEEV